MRLFEVIEYLADDTFLCARQLERQVANEMADGLLAACQRERVVGFGERAQVPETEVMRELLLESKSLLAGMTTLEQLLDVRVGRWPMQVMNRIGQRRHAEFRRYIVRQ